ncbi:hypothetical protein HY772_09315 [Candidatus Woesearchaeota archaeon]|nr:hypothetical protein [Candidatus Woesearchaeota archaeon]
MIWTANINIDAAIADGNATIEISATDMAGNKLIKTTSTTTAAALALYIPRDPAMTTAQWNTSANAGDDQKHAIKIDKKSVIAKRFKLDDQINGCAAVVVTIEDTGDLRNVEVGKIKIGSGSYSLGQNKQLVPYVQDKYVKLGDIFGDINQSRNNEVTVAGKNYPLDTGEVYFLDESSILQENKKSYGITIALKDEAGNKNEVTANVAFSKNNNKIDGGSENSQMSFSQNVGVVTDQNQNHKIRIPRVGRILHGVLTFTGPVASVSDFHITYAGGRADGTVTKVIDGIEWKWKARVEHCGEGVNDVGMIHYQAKDYIGNVILPIEENITLAQYQQKKIDYLKKTQEEWNNTYSGSTGYGKLNLYSTKPTDSDYNNDENGAGDGGGGDGGGGDGGGGGGSINIDPTFIRPWVNEITCWDSEGIGIENRSLVSVISVPPDGCLVRGDVPVVGIASGSRFKDYKIEYSKLGTEEWTLIAESANKQEEDIIPDWR